MSERDDFDARNENDRYSDPCASEDEANVDLLVAFQVIRELRQEATLLRADLVHLAESHARIDDDRRKWRSRTMLAEARCVELQRELDDQRIEFGRLEVKHRELKHQVRTGCGEMSRLASAS